LEHVWQIGFVASLATAEAIRRVSGIPARIKWPNDILVGGKKLAGILIESPSVTHADIGRAVIIGIGINVNTSSFPPELGDRGTSILLQKDPASRIEMSLVQDALLDMLDIRYGQYGVEGFPPILDSWKALDCTVGMVITALMSDGSVTGIAAGIDTDGNLIAQCDNGSLVSINAGEVLMR
jgi:BirA family biotin operon repressor/biotin-[acetyl-CoA-carboxylase] ligase